jgi:hypothetical protein
VRENVHFGATLRIPATAEALLEQSTYEVFTAQKTDGSGQFEKASDETLVYGWKKGGGGDRTREEQVRPRASTRASRSKGTSGTLPRTCGWWKTPSPRTSTAAGS